MESGGMRMLSPKKKSLLAFLILAAVFPLLALFDKIVPTEWATLKGAPLLLMAPAFFLAGRIRCPHCGTKVVVWGRELGTAVAALDLEGKMFQMRGTTALVALNGSSAAVRNGSMRHTGRIPMGDGLQTANRRQWQHRNSLRKSAVRVLRLAIIDEQGNPAAVQKEKCVSWIPSRQTAIPSPN